MGWYWLQVLRVVARVRHLPVLWMKLIVQRIIILLRLKIQLSIYIDTTNRLFLKEKLVMIRMIMSLHCVLLLEKHQMSFLLER